MANKQLVELFEVGPKTLVTFMIGALSSYECNTTEEEIQLHKETLDNLVKALNESKLEDEELREYYSYNLTTAQDILEFTLDSINKSKTIKE